MVSFTKATRLGEMAILSSDYQILTGRAPKSFRQVCQERLTNLRLQDTEAFTSQSEHSAPATDATVMVHSA